MFSEIVPTYDLLNHVLSCGLDILWRRTAAGRLFLQDGVRVLDMACGTGDMALTVAKTGRARVFGLDVSLEMIQQGGKKAQGKVAGFLQARAEKAPFRDGCFDAVTMVFGIRNIPDRGEGLREILRLLAPGGRAVILEFSPPRSRVLRFYLLRILPLVGNFLSETTAYTYLRDTIMEFPGRDGFARMMEGAGFTRVSWTDLIGGVATLYAGEKPVSPG